MIQIVFLIDGDSVANITPGSIAALGELPPVTALDYLQDVLCDAFDQYNIARERCGFARIEAWVRP